MPSAAVPDPVRPGASVRRARRFRPAQLARNPLWLLAVVVLSLPGCQSSPTPGSRREPGSGTEVLRVGTPFLGQPDPVRGGFNAVQFGVAETLTRLDVELRPQPWLATSFEQRSPTTWEVALRRDVSFHDGAPMDAQAVKASLERAIAVSASAKTLLGVREITVGDPHLLLITTETATPNLPGLLSEPATAIVNAASAKAQGDAFHDRPVTTGMFRVERYAADRELVAVRYDGYWGGRAASEQLVVSVLSDAGARFLALQSGQLDVALDIQPESVQRIEGDEDLRAVAAAPVSTIFAYLNHARAPLDDLRVRQALAHAIPARETVVRSVLRGQGQPAAGIFPPAVLSCSLAQAYPHDPEAARRLLAAAGYGDGDGGLDGKPLELVLLSYPQRAALTPTAEVLQAQLAAVGVTARIQVVEQVDEALERQSWDGSVYFNNFAATGDPYGPLSRFFRTGGDANAGRYSNQSVDRSIDRLRTLTDPEQRRDLACELERQLAQDVAVLPLAHPNYVYGVSSGVRGFDTAHPFFAYFMTGQIAKG